MTSTGTTTTTPTPWYANSENWVSIFTVLSLLLGAAGFSMTPADQHTLIVSGTGSAAGLVQFIGVLRRILASRA